jgi:hypothetical protein
MLWHLPRDDIQTLQDAARAHVLLWFFCRLCGHHGRFKPEAMAQMTRRDMTLEHLAPHLKCKRCGAMRAVVFPSDTSYPGRND